MARNRTSRARTSPKSDRTRHAGRRRPAPSEPRTEELPRHPLMEMQRMGGLEERISEVGRARAEAERRELEGEIRYDEAPGPDSRELLRKPKGPPRPPEARPPDDPAGWGE